MIVVANSMARVFGARWDRYRSALVGTLGVPALTLPDAADSVDLRSKCPWVRDQMGEECVGESLSGAHCLATGNAGKALSERGVWTAARARERNRRSDALEDVGCNPQDALDALIDVGGYPRDAKDDDSGALNDPWNWPEDLGAKKFDPQHFLPIVPGDLDTIKRVLTAGCGVVFWMQVTRSFMALQGTQVWQGVQPGEQILGGHAQCLAGFNRQGNFVAWGSYGTGFGDGGFPWIGPGAVAGAGAVAVLGGPVL